MRRRSRNIPRMPITKNADSGRSPQYCPRNRISRPHCSARSCQGGFVVSTKVFFEAPKNPNLFEPLTLCHVERSRSECDDVVETSRGCQSPKMQTQGVLPKDCHRNRISRPHCSARSCQQKLQLEPLRTLTILAWQSGENASYLRRYNQHSRDVSTPRRDDARRLFAQHDRVLGNLCWQHRRSDCRPQPTTSQYRPPSPSVMLSAVGANANDVVETSRECQSPKMQTQGVLPKDCPSNRIS
jgi:hypothetical protein